MRWLRLGWIAAALAAACTDRVARARDDDDLHILGDGEVVGRDGGGGGGGGEESESEAEAEAEAESEAESESEGEGEAEGECRAEQLRPGETVEGATGWQQVLSGCQGGTDAAPEDVWVVRLDQAARVQVDVEVLSEWDAVVYVLPSCERAPELACGNDRDLGESFAFDAGPGEYFVVVDGHPAGGARDQGPYRLTVQAEPRGGCAADAEPLAPGRTTGTTVGRPSQGAPTCSGSAAENGDVVYALALERRSEVALAVDAAGGAGFDPLVYLRADCADPASQLGCCSNGDDGNQGACANDGDVSTERLTLRLDAGRYFVFVDASDFAGPSEGEFVLDVAIRALAGEGAGCDPAGEESRCEAGLFCLPGEDGRHACRTPPCEPADITAATAAGEPWSGTTRDRPNHFHTGGAVGEGEACGGLVSPEDVLAYTLAQGPADLILDLEAGFQGSISARTACGEVASQLGCAIDWVGDGVPARLELRDLAAGTYFLFVDGIAGTSEADRGDYRLTVAARPVVGEGGDCGAGGRCAAGLACGDAGRCEPAACVDKAQDLALAEGAAAVTGTTAGLDSDDVSPSCSPDRDAPEAVYRLAVDFTGRLALRLDTTVTDDRADDWDAILYVLRDCADPASEVACRDGPDAVADERLDLDVTPGDYYIVVDGFRGAGGPFRLTVERLAP